MEEVKVFRKEYPRPQFERDSWLNLNGSWDFEFDDANIGEQERWYQDKQLGTKIMVPFTYETEASTIGEKKFHPYVWYRRSFKLPAEAADKKVLLHFQRVDYIAKVWVNGQLAGQHQGGYAAFCFDISHLVDREKDNIIVVKAEDSMSCERPRGKQRWVGENFGCWYTQTTGIWQTVWLEFVNEQYLKDVKMTPHVDDGMIEFEYKLAGNLTDRQLKLRTYISYNGNPVKECFLVADRASMRLKVDLATDFHHSKVHLWHPGHPNLYDVRFELLDGDKVVDSVKSYFGMRKVSIENGLVLINNRPVYQRLILDQGYWPESILTPPSEEAIIYDIDRIMEMGFNGVRKHQKVEDDRFLYWADKKGLLVWSEAAATYEYSDQAVDNFTKEWIDIVRQNYNHPSIITWVPFNESWGVSAIFTDRKQQQFTEAIYHLTHSLDGTRPVVVNDGWEHTVSDILTLHDYEELGEALAKRYQDKDAIVENEFPFNNHTYAMAKGYEYKGQPIIISEYGGIAFDAGEGWGYGNKVESEEDFLERYRKITKAIRDLPYVCGYCYTQVSDVEQEVNGLLTFDRKVKVAAEKIRKINRI